MMEEHAVWNRAKTEGGLKTGKKELVVEERERRSSMGALTNFHRQLEEVTGRKGVPLGKQNDAEPTNRVECA